MLQEIINKVVEKGERRPKSPTIDPKLSSLASQKCPDKALDEIEEEEEQSALESKADVLSDDLADDLADEETQEDSRFTSVRSLPLDENLTSIFTYHGMTAPDRLYDGTAKFEDEGYEAPTPISDYGDSPTYESLTEEVREELQDLKYDFLDPVQIDPRKKRLLAQYMTLNPAEFAFYEGLLGLNKDSLYQ